MRTPNPRQASQRPPLALNENRLALNPRVLASRVMAKTRRISANRPDGVAGNRARAAADRRLVDLDELIDRAQARKRLERFATVARAMQDNGAPIARARRAPSVLFPEPLTPVTHVRAASGMRASTAFRL